MLGPLKQSHWKAFKTRFCKWRIKTSNKKWEVDLKWHSAINAKCCLYFFFLASVTESKLHRSDPRAADPLEQREVARVMCRWLIHVKSVALCHSVLELILQHGVLTHNAIMTLVASAFIQIPAKPQVRGTKRTGCEGSCADEFLVLVGD